MSKPKKRARAVRVVDEPPPPAAQPQTLTVLATFNPVALARAESAGSVELASLVGAEQPGGMLDIAAWSANDLQDANDYLRERMRERDLVAAMLENTLAPLKLAKERIEAIFKPTLDIYDKVTTALKRAIGKYQLRAADEERAQLQAAAAAVSDESPEALTTALQLANEAAPEKLEGTSVRAVWKVKRIVPELLAREWWIPAVPDLQKIAKYGREHGPDDEPVIPGVVWEREARVTVRR